ncbi:MAG: M20 family metallopeptidase [Saprospiraceae bacterium]
MNEITKRKQPSIDLSNYDLDGMEAADYLSQYVQQASVTGDELEAGQFFANLCRNAGLHVEMFNEEKGMINFASSLYPLSSKKPNIIFVNHVDVVEAGNEQKWKYPPFSGEIAEGFVWGRGAYDNKGAAIVQFTGIKPFVDLAKDHDLPYNITMVSVCAEETFGDHGAKQVVENHLDLLNPVLVVGEGPVGVRGVVPSKPEQLLFGISVAHKHCLWLELSMEVEGTGHGSVPPLQYANKEMVKALNELVTTKPKLQFNKINVQTIDVLGDLEGGLKGFIMKKISFFKPILTPVIRKIPIFTALFSNTITVSNIRSEGTAHNAIPQKVVTKLDCRLLPETKREDFIAYVKSIIKNDEIKIKVVKQTPSAEPTDHNNPFFDELSVAIKKVYPDAHVFPMLAPNASDCNAFRSKGVLTLSTVPVEMTKEVLDCIHAPNERMPIEALIKGRKVITAFLESILNFKS